MPGRGIPTNAARREPRPPGGLALQFRYDYKDSCERVNYGLAQRDGGEEGGAYAVDGLEFWDRIYRIIQIDRITPRPTRKLSRP
jgi:hypothetical protein